MTPNNIWSLHIYMDTNMFFKLKSSVPYLFCFYINMFRLDIILYPIVIYMIVVLNELCNVSIWEENHILGQWKLQPFVLTLSPLWPEQHFGTQASRD